MITNYTTISTLAPEITLVVSALVVFLGGAFTRTRAAWAWFAIAALVAAGFAVTEVGRVPDNPSLTTQVLSGPLIVDGLSGGVRWFAVMLGLLFVLGFLPAQRSSLFTETIGLILFVFVGLMLVASAGDLVLLFLGLELISIPTYVLLFVGRNDKASAEATAKYFYLSILSSALLLYGFSMLYGMSGTTNLVQMREALAANSIGLRDSLMPLTLPFLLAGFGFKIAAAPFHFYAPDVYQSTTNLNAGLLAVVPKVAGIVAMVRILIEVMPMRSPAAWQIVVVLAIVTMTVANVSALWQKNFRRLLAYSSVANSGFLLMGLATAIAAQDESLRTESVAAMLIYVVFYSVASLGVFAALAYLDDDQTDFSQIRQLRGIGRRHPIVAAIIAICLFSLSGIPPLAGFWGKFLIFKSTVEVAMRDPAYGIWFWILAVFAAVNATIAAAYYLKVVGEMYFQPFEPAPQPRYLPAGSYATSWTAFLCAAAVLLFVSPGSIVQRAYDASRQLGTASIAAKRRPVPTLSGTRMERDRLTKAHRESTDGTFAGR